MSLKFLGTCLLISALSLPALGRTRESVSDDGYETRDSHGYIKSTQSDHSFEEIVERFPGVKTPCNGKEIPAHKARNARVQKYLRCDGQTSIHQVRRPEEFHTKEEFKAVLESGDPWKIHYYMRENSKNHWNYNLGYTTSIDWTWTKKMKGNNSSRCGYRYERTTCTKTTRVEKETCVWVDTPDYDSGSGGGGFSPSGGGGGGGFSPSGGGGGGYETKNPFTSVIDKAVDVVIPEAHASGYNDCSWSFSHYDYDDFTCYDRFPKNCSWTETERESKVCSSENVPVQVNILPKSEDQWNPRVADYVPFLPNGNDLIPGESELLTMDISISGNQLSHTTPKVGGGEDGSKPAHYVFEHDVQVPPLQCQQNAQMPPLKWELTSKSRQVGVTPNSLVSLGLDRTRSVDSDRDSYDKTGLFDLEGNQLLDGSGQVKALPSSIRILDTSSRILNSITSAFRNQDNDEGSDEVSHGDEVELGKVTAKEGQAFWKDTFYRVQLVEVYPGRSKDPRYVAVSLVQTDSLIKRRKALITIPLAGQYSDTESAYDLSSSGVVIPKNYFRTVGEQYQMIPGQTYELRISMLHRGIPFYFSGCSDNAISCEREEPNVKAFSDEKAIRFVYQGEDERGIFKIYYDKMRRVNPW